MTRSTAWCVVPVKTQNLRMLISKSKTCTKKQWALYATLQNAPQSNTNSGVWTLVLTSKVAKVEYLVLMTLIWLLYNKYAWRFENWYQSRCILWITTTAAAAHSRLHPAATKNPGCSHRHPLRCTTACTRPLLKILVVADLWLRLSTSR